MPIKIQDDLPAKSVLEDEHIFVMTETRALSQDIRPLKIVILNLMPTKIETETQILRRLSNTPLQIEITLLQTATHESKNVSEEHMIAFYQEFDQIKDENYDGMIITGAPVEMMPYEEVEYWDELCEIMEWSKTHVHSTFHICWGAQAGLYYHYGIPKYILDKKISGVFSHKVLNKKSRLFRGFDGYILCAAFPSYGSESRGYREGAGTENYGRLPRRPVFMLWAVRMIPSSLSWAIQSTMWIHWRENISGMQRRE